MAFIDKINPDVPEGRLLIRNGEFILKDPDAEVSKIPLDKKWDKLLKYIKDQMYSDSEVDMMICAYGHICICHINEKSQQRLQIWLNNGLSAT